MSVDTLPSLCMAFLCRQVIFCSSYCMGPATLCSLLLVITGGAGSIQRVKSIAKCCLAAGAVISIGGTLIMLFCPEVIATLFLKENEKDLMAMSAYALQIYSLTYLTRWFGFAMAKLFDCFGKAASGNHFVCGKRIRFSGCPAGGFMAAQTGRHLAEYAYYIGPCRTACVLTFYLYEEASFGF